ncbi:hypothetical protein OR571_19175 [Psychrobacillus sp. NEAU-3TGS]|uniref:hypothetical protein n=1 Tax=Psychrobacillus sp. NEAU-3TGS TaxID=2995412 RepID=UPI002498BF1C|nr:hypothetical protein [Psychrobacillus sp. NEAU-3TGS]MDI2589161.1 hypothetical protein [Psychrobacillus sp. NEAU-3TGS]
MISIKKITLALVFLILLLLFACQAKENDLIFSGEGENWSSKVTVSQTDGDESYKFQINYKEYSKQDIPNFSYNVEAKNGGVIDFSENNVSLDNEGLYQSDFPISNSASTSIKDELVIKVEWDGKSEEFTLIKK